MKISIIVAIGRENEIGRNGKLLCHLPTDLKHFKEITSGRTVIMGRKTFDSLPKGPLPNRANIVLSRQTDLTIDGATVCSSLEEALQLSIHETEVFIMGGEAIYRQSLPLANKLYLTLIHASFPEADAFFPAIDFREWREIRRERLPSDERNVYGFSFLELEK
jgi:dihydrofolate reductase